MRIREIDLRDTVFCAITLAQAEISKIRVGAAVLATNSKGDSSIFSGCNIEISFSRAFHEENVALLKAISSGYTNIKAVAVTSDSETKLGAAMCGCCRQDYIYLNPDCMIYVFNSDKSLKPVNDRWNSYFHCLSIIIVRIDYQ